MQLWWAGHTWSVTIKRLLPVYIHPRSSSCSSVETGGVVTTGDTHLPPRTQQAVRQHAYAMIIVWVER